MRRLEYMVDLPASKIVKLVCASLVIALQFYLSGCATPKAWDLAKRKASPTNCSYLDITSVKSAVERENGDISICVELNDSNAIESTSYMFTLPFSSLAEDPTDVQIPGLRPCMSSSVPCCWYPIEKATRDCIARNSDHGSPETLLPIEKLTVPAKDKPHLYDIMSNLSREQDEAKKLYEVTFTEEPMEVEFYSYDKTTDKMVFEQSTESREIVLVYYPPQAAQKGIKPLIIVGGYKDTKTNLYYLLVPPAFAFDASLIAAVAFGTAILPYAILGAASGGL